MSGEGPAARVLRAWRSDEWVKPFVVRYGRVLALAVFLGVVAFVFAGGLMFTSGYMISLAATLPFTVLAVHVPTLYVRIFGIGKPILQYLERLQSHDWALRMTSELRRKLYEVIERNAARGTGAANKLGDVLGLLAEDVEHVQNLYLRTVFPLVVAWVVYVLAVVALGVFSWPAALALALLLGVVVLVLPAVSVCVNGARLQRAKAVKARLYAELTDNVLGVADWVFSGRGEEYALRYRRLQQEARRLDEQVARFARMRELFAQVMFGLAALAVLMWASSAFGSAEGAGIAGSAAVQALGSHQPANASLHAANWVAAFALCFFPLVEAFSPASEAAMGLVTYGDSIDRMNACSGSVAGTKRGGRFSSRLDDGESSASSASLTPCASRAGSDDCAVRLENVVFSYEAGAPAVLDGVSLSVPCGQKVAVLGRSGEGKSTLAALIRGELSPLEGEVLVIGCSAAEMGERAANAVGIIHQNPHLFNWTLRDNLRLGRLDATDSELVQVMERVGLGDLLGRLPQGLDTMVDESGRRFSGGERHRIALARVRLARTPVVILDEPFSGLDPATEQALLDTVLDVLADCTVILITHHLQGVSACDRVLFLEKGSVVVDGAPSALERVPGRYRDLLALDGSWLG
ncbi:MAG: thiol reductant ABC exporter subunit CydC [Eggerthellaceae bacterium]|nr:thiol reductant ABC exporter subunit CydC [Eggerthellaceae bacterium]